MRAFIAAGLALSVAMALAGQAAEAAARKDEKQYSARQGGAYYRQSRGRSHPNARPNWYPHVMTELPFGSKRWWEQQERERGGSSRD